jgi:AraC-like DNA-binding protein
MTTPSDIRQIFKPIQPVHQFGDKVQYSEVLPDVKLRPFIMCFWEFKSRHRFTDDFFANIVSDGCIDIFFEISRPHENYVMGFLDKSTAFHFESSFHYMGIRFAPAMFPYLFRINASELTNKVEQLSLVHRQTAGFISTHVMPGHTLGEVASLFDDYFLKLVSKPGSEIDPRFHQALFTILQNPGVGNLEKNLYNQVALSPRHLRRLFDYYVGSNVKSFSKVVRFQNFLRAHIASSNAKEKLYFDFGYYDQSHFIKEFKTFYGSTPGTALRS